MKAILLVSHGSYSQKTKQEVESLVVKLKKDLRDFVVEYAFLEIDHPSIPEGIKNCIKSGAKEIIVTLNFLNSGKHVDEDIPQIIKQAQAKFPEIKMDITQPIGQHPGISELFRNLIENFNS